MRVMLGREFLARNSVFELLADSLESPTRAIRTISTITAPKPAPSFTAMGRSRSRRMWGFAFLERAIAVSVVARRTCNLSARATRAARCGGVHGCGGGRNRPGVALAVTAS